MFVMFWPCLPYGSEEKCFGGDINLLSWMKGKQVLQELPLYAWTVNGHRLTLENFTQNGPSLPLLIGFIKQRLTSDGTF